MLANIIVGLVVFVLISLAFIKTRNDIKNNKCSCGSSCSGKKSCNITKIK